jgi:hypothetical protein
MVNVMLDGVCAGTVDTSNAFAFFKFFSLVFFACSKVQGACRLFNRFNCSLAILVGNAWPL